MDDVQLCELLSIGACPITISITVRYILGILCRHMHTTFY